jgi:hypothetical protein
VEDFVLEPESWGEALPILDVRVGGQNNVLSFTAYLSLSLFLSLSLSLSLPCPK